MPFLAAFVICLVLTPLARGLGLAIGLVDRPEGDLAIHRQPVAVLGGLAVAGAALGAQALTGGWLPWTVTTSTLLTLAVGLLDDARPLPAWARVVLLAGAGSVLLAGGTGMEAVGAVGWAGLVLLVLACANAVNIVDGQDGLAGGLAMISALGLAGVARLEGDPATATLGLVLAGAAGGFLPWNLSPVARVFLGNSGAYGVGTLVAIMAARVAAIGGLRGVLAAGACLGPFAFEVAFTVARRIRARERLAGGDRLHSYDLVATATSRTASTVTFWALGAVSAGLGLLIAMVPLAVGIPAVSLAVVGAIWWAVLLWRRRGLRNLGVKDYGAGRMAAQEPDSTVD